MYVFCVDVQGEVYACIIHNIWFVFYNILSYFRYFYVYICTWIGCYLTVIVCVYVHICTYMLSDTWTIGFLALKLSVFLGPKVRGALRQGLNEAFVGEGLGFTSTLQNLLFCRVLLNSY